MAQLVDSRGFQLAPDLAGGLAGGIQTGQQLRGQFTQQAETEAEIGRQDQFRQLSGIANDPNRPPEERLAAQQQAMAVDPERQEKAVQQHLATRSAQEQSLFKSVVTAANQINAIPTLEGKLQAAKNRKQQLLADGITNTTETDLLISSLEAGDEAGAQALLDKGIEAGQLAGILQPGTSLDAGGEDFLKEERKTAAQDVRSFNNKAREMRTSFTKMEGLAKQAKTGSRGARNAMTVSLARLISPGIVTETEASALSGGQNSMQAIFQALAGKGFDIEKLQTHIDPFGETFDAEGLLKVGKSVVASSRQPLIDMFENSRARAERSGMSKKAFDTNFLNNPSFSYLQSFEGDADTTDDLTSAEQAELDQLEAIEARR